MVCSPGEGLYYLKHPKCSALFYSQNFPRKTACRKEYIWLKCGGGVFSLCLPSYFLCTWVTILGIVGKCSKTCPTAASRGNPKIGNMLLIMLFLFHSACQITDKCEAWIRTSSRYDTIQEENWHAPGKWVKQSSRSGNAYIDKGWAAKRQRQWLQWNFNYADIDGHSSSGVIKDGCVFLSAVPNCFFPFEEQSTRPGAILDLVQGNETRWNE